jgi:hypothetical protein
VVFTVDSDSDAGQLGNGRSGFRLAELVKNCSRFCVDSVQIGRKNNQRKTSWDADEKSRGVHSTQS